MISYFHKGITRMEAEDLLLSAKGDGSFLVRDSETLTGAYVLCLLYQTRVHQYRVLPGQDGKLSVQAEGGSPEPRYPDLNTLIEDYIRKGDKNGLAYPLKYPVQPAHSDEPESDDDDSQEVYDDSVQVVPTSPLEPDFCNSSGGSSLMKIQRVLMKNFSRLDCSGYDQGFVESLKNYADKGIEKDIDMIRSGDSTLPEYQQLIEKAASGLQRQLDLFFKKMITINELMTIPEANSGRFAPHMKDSNQSTRIQVMMEKMSQCRSDIMAMENKVQETLRYFSSVSQYDYVPVPVEVEDQEIPKTLTPLLSSLGKPHIPRSDFDVKLIRHGKFQSKMILTIDILQGKLFMVKPSKDALDPSSVITHDRVLQLVKCTKENSRLDLVFSGKKKYTVSFDTPHVRENFCQQIMQMKNLHSTQMDVDQISIFVGTWNMGDSQPVASINSWLKCSGCGKIRDPQVLGVIPHDLYVIGTQESALTEKEWVHQVKNHIKSSLNADLELVEVCSLWGIRIIILVKNQLRQHINRVQRSTVRTGIANALGNKGAVAISFYFKGTSMCFINAHLTSGDERNDKRNQNYRDIIKGLSVGQKHLELFDVTNRFHHVFWLGDLNYRVEDSIDTILEKLESKEMRYLLEKDQLKKSQREKKGFSGFSEEEITFMPTYRLPRFSTEWKYDWRKVKASGVRINSPSWCDRVLWRSYPGTYLENLAYGCADKVLGSDHRPVFASFNVGIASDFVMNRDSLVDETQVKIVFHSVVAQVKTCCKQYFYLEFHSTCLPQVVRSKPNTEFKEHRTGFYTCPHWEKNQLHELRPLFGDEDFLSEQHVLIAVRSRDSDNESYGECVLELKNKFDLMPQEFNVVLFHQGEETGKLSGQFHVLLGNMAPEKCAIRNSKKSYELVTLDTEYIDPELWHPDSPNFSGRKDLRNSLQPDPEPENLHSTLTQVLSTPTNQQSRNPATRSSADDCLTSASKSGRNQPFMGQASLQAMGRQGPPSRSNSVKSKAPSSSPPTEPPPLVPRKPGNYVNYVNKSATEYPVRQEKPKGGPAGVAKWLQELGMNKYLEAFLKNGFDSMQYLEKISRTDLVKIGIENITHRNIILDSLSVKKK